MPNQTIIIIASAVLGVPALIYVGFLIGAQYWRKKISQQDFDALGEDYHRQISTLKAENEKHKERWGKIGKMIHSFGTVPELEIMAQKLSRTITEEVLVKYSAVLMRESDSFKAIASDGLHISSQEALEFPIEDPLVKYMGNFPDAVEIKENQRQFKIFRKLREPIKSIIMMPLRVGDDIIGLIWAGRDPNSESFTEGQKAVLSFLGNSLGYLIRNRELIRESEERALKIVTSLVKALEQKDDHTKGHSDHVASYSEVFAQYIGIEKQKAKIIKRAAQLHDIGKIGIPDSILLKPDKLTAEEFEIMKSHPVFGAELLKTLGFLKEELLLILHHHEKYDGTGYPYGLRGDRIPQGAVIISLADVFDALTSDQPFRKAYSIDEALKIMEKMEGEHFEPTVLYHFLNFIRSRLKMQEEE